MGSSISTKSKRNEKREILRQGWVYKYSKHLKQKRKRWLVIFKIENPFETVLLTYDKNKSLKSKPTLVLRNANKSDISSYYGDLNSSKNEYHFQVKSKYGSYVFECIGNGLNRQLEKLIWMSYIENGLADSQVSKTPTKEEVNSIKDDNKEKETYPSKLDDVVQDLQDNTELPEAKLHLPHYDFKWSDWTDTKTEENQDLKVNVEENEHENKIPFNINIYDAQSGTYCESKNNCEYLLTTKKMKLFHKLNEEIIEHIMNYKHKRMMCSHGNSCQHFMNVQSHYILGDTSNKIELCDKFHCRLYYHPASRIQNMIDVGVEYNVGDSLTVFQCRGHCGAVVATLFHSAGLPVSFDHEVSGSICETLNTNRVLRMRGSIFGLFWIIKPFNLDLFIRCLWKPVVFYSQRMFLTIIMDILTPDSEKRIKDTPVLLLRQKIQHWFYECVDEFTLKFEEYVTLKSGEKLEKYKLPQDEAEKKLREIALFVLENKLEMAKRLCSIMPQKLQHENQTWLSYCYENGLFDGFEQSCGVSMYIIFFAFLLHALADNYLEFFDIICLNKCNTIEEELKKNGFEDVLILKDSETETLNDVVNIKMNCKEHKRLGYPLNKQEILSVLLYTGTKVCGDMIYKHRKKNFCKWKNVQTHLYNAIRKLGIASMKQNIPKPKVLYRGMFDVDLTGKSFFSTPTFFSASIDKNVSLFFMNEHGCLLEINEFYAETDNTHADVSWLSHFNDEKEYLFIPSKMMVKSIRNINSVQIAEIKVFGKALPYRNIQDVRSHVLASYAEYILPPKMKEEAVVNEYKPSLNNGIYGSYMYNRNNQYKPSLNSGIFGSYIYSVI
eukprot:464375_1